MAVIVLAGLGALIANDFCRAAEPDFPFDQELVLDAPPMRPAKHRPSLTVAASGAATLDLWCKSVPAQVEFTDDGIKIVAGPLPDALPQMMGNGQCAPDRMQADQTLLDALSQMSGWKRQGDAVVLTGATTLRYLKPTN
jgi:heat shock protein HslJ